jgi:hypothetical protein
MMNLKMDQYKHQQEALADDNHDANIKSDFFSTLKDSIFSAFGDFGAEENYIYWDEQISFAMSVVMLCLIMLNLLIGVLSEELAKVLAS